MNSFLLKLARNSAGRVLLHVAAAMQDGHVDWHWRGVVREWRLQRQRFAF